MGQYYLAVILGPEPNSTYPNEFIRAWVNSFTYGGGSKLMEHSYLGNGFTNAIEHLLSPEGPFWKSRIVWAGDYADREPDIEGDKNLYTLADEEPKKQMIPEGDSSSPMRYPFVVNHTKKLAVDTAEALTDAQGFRIHPLPLLVSEGNGRGGGDYHGAHMDLVGSWARDVISMERKVPAGYTLIDAEFQM